jgi:hypothetical protein
MERSCAVRAQAKNDLMARIEGRTNTERNGSSPLGAHAPAQAPHPLAHAASPTGSQQSAAAPPLPRVHSGGSLQHAEPLQQQHEPVRINTAPMCAILAADVVHQAFSPRSQAAQQPPQPSPADAGLGPIVQDLLASSNSSKQQQQQQPSPPAGAGLDQIMRNICASSLGGRPLHVAAPHHPGGAESSGFRDMQRQNGQPHGSSSACGTPGSQDLWQRPMQVCRMRPHPARMQPAAQPSHAHASRLHAAMPRQATGYQVRFWFCVRRRAPHRARCPGRICLTAVHCRGAPFQALRRPRCTPRTACSRREQQRWSPQSSLKLQRRKRRAGQQLLRRQRRSRRRSLIRRSMRAASPRRPSSSSGGRSLRLRRLLRQSMRR